MEKNRQETPELRENLVSLITLINIQQQSSTKRKNQIQIDPDENLHGLLGSHIQKKKESTKMLYK